MKNSKNAILKLKDYYAKTAENYDNIHSMEAEHQMALKIISGLIFEQNYNSCLDVGCGTGRGLSFLKQRHPNLLLLGVDISPDLLNIAVNKNGIDSNKLLIANGCKLPFHDETFDLVIALGLMHHVENPNKIVSEMLRVAKFCIAISDSNFYPQGWAIFKPGNILGAILKFFLLRVGVWFKLKKLITGHTYSYSEGDGIFFTYSVFETLRFLRTRKDVVDILFIPTSGFKNFFEISILYATNGLILATKKPFLT